MPAPDPHQTRSRARQDVAGSGRDIACAATRARIAPAGPRSLAVDCELAETVAAVAYGIETEPDALTSAQVIAYLHSAAQGRVVLAAAHAEQGERPALAAARRVAQDAVVVASAYIQYR